MEPITIAVICTLLFGAVTALAVFIRHLLLSRDKRLNDLAQQRALLQESTDLEKIRCQMESNKRFNSHYLVLGANKEAIRYIDDKIQGVLDKKMELIQRYGQITFKESSVVISDGQSAERKALHYNLKAEIDQQIKFYNQELEQLQSQRATVWDSNLEVQNFLIAHEEDRNEKLDKLYISHTGMLEKIYLRHAENSEQFAEQTLEAGTESFKAMLMFPIRLLSQYFRLASNVSPERMEEEKTLRRDVLNTEKTINDHYEDKKLELDEIFDDTLPYFSF